MAWNNEVLGTDHTPDGSWPKEYVVYVTYTILDDEGFKDQRDQEEIRVQGTLSSTPEAIIELAKTIFYNEKAGLRYVEEVFSL